jgi:hypothetical protein
MQIHVGQVKQVSVAAVLLFRTVTHLVWPPNLQMPYFIQDHGIEQAGDFYLLDILIWYSKLDSHADGLARFFIATLLGTTTPLQPYKASHEEWFEAVIASIRFTQTEKLFRGKGAAMLPFGLDESNV